MTFWPAGGVVGSRTAPAAGRAAGFGVAQLEAALAVADGVVDVAGIKMRDLEHVDDG